MITNAAHRIREVEAVRQIGILLVLRCVAVQYFMVMHILMFHKYFLFRYQLVQVTVILLPRINEWRK